MVLYDNTLHYHFYRDPENNRLTAQLSCDQGDLLKLILPIEHYESENEAIQAEFKLLKYHLSKGYYQIANVNITPEFQDLFTEILNDPNINDDDPVINVDELPIAEGQF